MNFGEILTTILGVMMSIGHFPQAYKIWKQKSSATTSLITYLIFSVGAVVWVLYGISVHDMVIVISFAPGAVGACLVLALAIYYRKKQKTS